MRKISHFTILCLFLLSLTGMLLLPLCSQAQTTTPNPTPPPPPPADIYILGTCFAEGNGGGGGGAPSPLPPTKFFANYFGQPDSVLWSFNLPDTTITSKQLHPAFSFPEAATYEVQLSVWENGNIDSTWVIESVTISNTDTQLQIMDITDDPQNPEPVSGELVICPGETKNLRAQETGGSGGTGGGQGGGSSGGSPVTVRWFKPQSALQPPPNPETNSEITVSAEDQDGDGEWDTNDVGTYYVLYEDPNGCQIVQSFRVVIYEEDSQNSSRWHFGNNAGIDFEDNSALPAPSPYNAPEGNAIIGDVNADILFITDGEGLWYGNNMTPTQNGNSLGGSSSVTQNSLFMDFPNEETLYFLFTIDANGQLSFSTLDLASTAGTDIGPDVAEASPNTQNAGTLIKTIPLAQQVAEKLTSASRTDGGSWLVVHETGNNSFLSFPVTGEGIGQAVRSDIGSTISAPGEGYIRFNEDGSILANTVNTPSNMIELFRFDADTGTVGPEMVQIPIDEAGTLYGLAFSDTMMYASVFNGTDSYFYQFAVDSALTEADIIASQVKITVPGEKLGAIEMGPDGTLYIARNGSTHLYTITSPGDKLADDFEFRDPGNTFDLEGPTSTLGLPNFGQNSGTSVPEGAVSTTDVCTGDPVEISGTRRYSNDETFVFTIYDENNNPVHGPIEVSADEGALTIEEQTYQGWGTGSGTFKVTMGIINECSPDPTNPDYPGPGDQPVEAVFTISPIPEAAIDNSNNLILCEDQGVTLEGYAVEPDGSRSTDASKYTFVWVDEISGFPIPPNSNDVIVDGNKLTVSEGGSFRLVVIDNATGCMGESAPQEVLDNRPDFDLGDDIVICEGGDLGITELNASFSNDNEYNFKWVRISGSNRTEPPVETSRLSLNGEYGVDTEFPGSYRYIVEVTPTGDAVCFKADTIDITISAAPRVSIVASDNNCSGSANLTAVIEGAVGDISYSWSGPGIVSGRGTNKIRINQTGDYFVEITDAATQCGAVSEPYYISIEAPLEDLKIELEAGCGSAAQNLLTAVTGYTGNGLEFQWFRKEGSNFVPIPNSNTQEIYTEEGEYQVIATINNPGSGCNGQQKEATKSVSKTELPLLQSTYVICPNIPEMARDTITLEGYESYEWKTAGGQVVGRGPTLIITQEGKYELRVNGCSEPTRFRVVYDCTPVLWLPNAIRFNSPVNGNGTFKILNPKMAENVKDFQILILNRWGEVLFQSNDPLFEWNGTDRSGQPVMINTYVYVITYRNRFGEDSSYKHQRGGITVLK